MAKHITNGELAAMIEANAKGCQWVGFTTSTCPDKITKKARSNKEIKFSDLYPKGIRHIERFGCGLGVSVENWVNNQRKREGKPADFKVQPLWNGKGQHEGKTLIRHVDKDEVYFYLIKTNTDDQGKPIPMWSYWIDLATNRIIEGEEFKRLAADFLPPVSKPKNQEITKTVPVRTVKVNNVKRAVYAGETFICHPDGEVYGEIVDVVNIAAAHHAKQEAAAVEV